MMGRLFGTDGIRGVANTDLTAQLALDVASATVSHLGKDSTRRVVVVGRDPRVSGDMLEAAVIAGITRQGFSVLRAGMLPTPAIAYLTQAYYADCGIMISASHNPMQDNGIKIFTSTGGKLDQQAEEAIEYLTFHPVHHGPSGAEIGRVIEAVDAQDCYLRHIRDTNHTRLEGLTVVVDCAYGAASFVGPRAYQAAGAEVISLHDCPDGFNINQGCGSTHLEVLQQAVCEHGADLGLAHDGDADRCLAVDARGQIVDGDAIMAILALGMHARGELAHNTVVATTMSNLGFHHAMRDAGIEVCTTDVGDRYVLEQLHQGGYSLGGEQSGHILIPGLSSTGDGIITGLQLMARMASTGRSLEHLASVMTSLPQVLMNVAVEDKHQVLDHQIIRDELARAEQELAGQGRIMLRASGTESVVRVMVEAPSSRQAHEIAERMAAYIRTHQSG